MSYAGCYGCFICEKAVWSDTTHLHFSNEKVSISICKDCLNKYIVKKEE